MSKLEPTPLVNQPSSSSSSSSEEEEDDIGSEAMENRLRNIIRVLTSGSTASNAGASNVLSILEETDSDSDDVESGAAVAGQGTRQTGPALPRIAPDTSRIEKSEITLLTERAVGSEGNRSIVDILSRRELGHFSSKTRKRLSSCVLPDTGKKVATMRNKVFCGVYGRDGDIFLSACQDRGLRIFDTSRGNFKLLQSLQARDVGWAVLDVALSPSGSHLVYSSWNDYLYQVHILGDGYSNEGYEVEQIPLCLDPPGHHQFCIFSVKFSQDSSELLGGANDGCLYLYDREAQTQSQSISAHDRDVNAVCFVDETTHILASGGDDGMCKVWDRRSLRESNPRPVGVLAGHSDGIAYIDSRGDGRFLISNSKDQSIKLWDIRRFSQAHEIEESKNVVRRNHHWDYRWERVPKANASFHGSTSTTRDCSVMTYTGHSVLQTLIRCHFSPEHSTGKRYIYTGCASGGVVIYDLLTGNIAQRLSGHKACVRDVAWHPYFPEIISSSWDFTVTKWEHRGSAKDEIESLEKSNAPAKKKRRRCRISGLLEEDQLLELDDQQESSD